MIKDARTTVDALLLDAALENIPYGFCVWSSSFQLVMWNKPYLDIYNFPPDRIRRGMSLEEVVALSAEAGNHPGQSAAEFAAAYRQQLLDNRGGARAKLQEMLSGDRIVETAHIFSPGLGWVVTHEDVTDEIQRSEIVQRRKSELERQNIRLDAAVNNISQGLCMYDAQGRLVICNKPYQRIYNLPEHLLVPGTRLDDILGYLFDQGMSAGDDRDGYIRWRREVISRGEYGKNIHELNGRIIMMQHHPMKDGGWVSTHEDITEQRQTEARMRHLARHDALTDLPNRLLFRERVEHALAQSGRSGGFAVLCVGLDKFKTINETLGHPVGDKLLVAVAARLRACVRDIDTIARLGGDEFAVVQTQVAYPEDAALLSRRIINAVSEPFDIEGHRITIGCSVGISVAPGDGTSSDKLIKGADVALYRAKTEGRGTWRFFEAEMDARLQARRAIELDLRNALDNGEFEVFHQPIFDLDKNRFSGCEALVRWRHPVNGLISPDGFITIVEDIGEITRLGEWVLRRACEDASRWPTGMKVAVNVSPMQFRDAGLVQAVRNALTASGLPAQRLELEITESVLLANNTTTLATLHELRALGVRIALDDFGTGYSSLSYLRSFPFDKIKIDRSFVRDLTAADGSKMIVRAIINLSKNLGMVTTAEGVETNEQLDTIRTEGCDEVQGFLFARPVPVDALPEVFHPGRKSKKRPILRAV